MQIELHGYKIRSAEAPPRAFIQISDGTMARAAFGRAAERAQRKLARLQAAGDTEALLLWLVQIRCNGFPR